MSEIRKPSIAVQGIWESVHNPVFKYGEFATINSFKPIEFEGFKKQAGLNSLILTAKQWIEKKEAIRLVSKSGYYV
jgi:hypothetical protein